MAALSPFYSDRPGVEQGRVDNPSGFSPPEGTAALVLGSDRAGFFRKFKVGDKIEVFQSDAPGAAEKIVSLCYHQQHRHYAC